MSQPLVVFWSWQSDHPSKIAKNFVKEAFHSSLKIMEENLDINFDSRPDEVKLDNDTKGLIGPVDILDELKKKIDACDHYLADITPVGRTEAGKALPNPNVMIELGYALKTKSIEQITFVANSHFYKGVKDLPFDISKRRQPLCYKLRPNSKEEKIKRETNKFAQVLLQAIQSVKPLTEVKDALAANALSPTDRYSFLRDGSSEIIGYVRSQEKRFRVPKQPYPFLKIAPSRQIRPLLNKELNPDAKGMSMFVGVGNGGEWIRQYDGWTVVETFQNKPSVAVSITKTFMKTGTIWNIDYSNGRDRDGERYLGDLIDYHLFDENKGRYLDLTNVPEHWFKYIIKALEAYRHLGIDGPFDIQAGMFVGMPLDVKFNASQMYIMTGSSNRIFMNKNLSSERECIDVTSQLFEGLLDAAAYEFGFPAHHLASRLGASY